MLDIDIESSSKFPRLEQVLLDVGLISSKNVPKEISPKVSPLIIDGTRHLLNLAHGNVRRKSGGWYNEEHIAPMGEIGLKLGLPPFAILGFLLHDFKEDHDNVLFSRRNRKQKDEKEHNARRNIGVLEQQLFGGAKRGSSFKTLDRKILLSQVSLATKPFEGDVCEIDFNNPFYNSDKRFTAKVLRCLKKYPYDNLDYLDEHEISLSTTTRFYSQLTVLSDMFLNLGINETPEDKLSPEKIEKFMRNKFRNVKRMISFVPMLDSAIRSSIDYPHCLINTENYNSFMREVVAQTYIGIAEHEGVIDKDFKASKDDFLRYVEQNYLQKK